jgi:hypothetical protein
LSITEAAKLVSLDRQFSGLIPGMKTPRDSEGDPGSSSQFVPLGKYIKDVENQLCQLIDSGKLKPNSVKRSLDDKLIPEQTVINFNALCVWLTEHGHEPGKILSDYMDKESWILSRIEDEVAYLRGVKNWQNSPNCQDIIGKLSQQNKLEEASPSDLASGFKTAVIEMERLKKEVSTVSAELTDLDRPGWPRERRTMLTIMAALCRLAKVKYAERGEAKKIELESEEMGAPVTDDTIRKYFEQIQKTVKIKKVKE